MASDGSVSRLIDGLMVGDAAAVQQLWGRYFGRLVGLARKHLRDAPRRVADEEDVALSAFDSFLRGAEQGRFPDLADREGLWALLLTITARKAFHLLRDQQRHKRGGPGPRPAEDAAWEDVLGREPSPDVAAEMAEAYRRLLDCLPDPELRSLAVWKMEGDSVAEVARKLDCSPRSVKRMTRLIREVWEKEVEA
jgi:DNA-directed RNA polymerase specialized sigma24 family protein